MNHSESTFSTLTVWAGVWLALALLCSGVALFFTGSATGALAHGFVWGSAIALGFMGALLAYVAFALALRVPGCVMKRLRRTST